MLTFFAERRIHHNSVIDRCCFSRQQIVSDHIVLFQLQDLAKVCHTLNAVHMVRYSTFTPSCYMVCVLCDVGNVADPGLRLQHTAVFTDTGQRHKLFCQLRGRELNISLLIHLRPIKHIP